jgi:predicted membrane protein
MPFVFSMVISFEGLMGGVNWGRISHFAFRISHTCSVVFMIMRFPLCVVAIMGVEAGCRRRGRHVLVLSCGLVCFVVLWRVLLSFPSGVT